MKQPSIEITERESGPNGWVAALLAGAIAGAMVILAVAIWQLTVTIAAGVMVAIVAAGVGFGLERTCYGLSMLIYHARRGQAEIERARLGQPEHYPQLEEGTWTSRRLR